MTKINADQFSLADLRKAYMAPTSVDLSEERLHEIKRAQQTILDIVDNNRTVYGVNTGFGLLASNSIPQEKLSELQVNLLLSHSAGVGKPLSDDVVRLSMVLKLLSLSQGHSGVQMAVIDGLNALLRAEIYPFIPEKGSVGASGDLAPLSAMAAVLIGVGKVHHKGQLLSAKEGLEIAGVDPVDLGPKEGLALINGTQISNALAMSAYFKIENILAAALVAGALTVDAALGSDTPFDDRIHKVRGQVGQRNVAAVYRDLLAGSEIRHSHENCDRVQDPYCLRCQPQVMGAALDFVEFSGTILERESRAVSDNPVVFPDEGDVLSGGNFHAEPVALAADNLAIALTEIGNISERRISMLMDKNMSQLPAFLVEDSGVNSGFMIAQVTAAALASENKQMAHPGSVDTIPTSANQEDHVSMATHSARRLHDMAENAASIVAVEFLSAAQGVDFRAPLKTSDALQKVHGMIREKVPHYTKDRVFTDEIEALRDMILAGDFNQFVGTVLPSQN